MPPAAADTAPVLPQTLERAIDDAIIAFYWDGTRVRYETIDAFVAEHAECGDREVGSTLLRSEEFSLAEVAQAIGWTVEGDAIVPDTWTMAADDCGVYTDEGDGDVEDALDDFDAGEFSYVMTVTAWRMGLDDEGDDVKAGEHSSTRTIHPEAPPCAGVDFGHLWCSPHSLVGGLKENPGVWGSGYGSIRQKDVCAYCGTQRTVDSGATNPVNGQRMTSISYEAEDADTLDWVRRMPSAAIALGWKRAEDLDAAAELLRALGVDRETLEAASDVEAQDDIILEAIDRLDLSDLHQTAARFGQ